MKRCVLEYDCVESRVAKMPCGKLLDATEFGAVEDCSRSAFSTADIGGLQVNNFDLTFICCGSFSSDEITLILFWGNTWSDKMSNQKRIGLEGTIKAYAGCSRIITSFQGSSTTE